MTSETVSHNAVSYVALSTSQQKKSVYEYFIKLPVNLRNNLKKISSTILLEIDAEDIY